MDGRVSLSYNTDLFFNTADETHDVLLSHYYNSAAIRAAYLSLIYDRQNKKPPIFALFLFGIRDEKIRGSTLLKKCYCTLSLMPSIGG